MTRQAKDLQHGGILHHRAHPAINIDQGVPSRAIQRALTGASSFTPAEVLQLQRLVGNGAVSRLLARAPGPRQRPATPDDPVVQRHIKNKSYVNYGGTNAQGVGTTMEAEFWALPGQGSKPTVEPNWWPHAPDIAAPFFRNYMVQGHLLNDNIGGPGNTMNNLTPITRSANTMHERKIERAVKAHVQGGGKVVDYHVYADYNGVPKAMEIAPNESDDVQNHIDATYAWRLPRQIVAEFTAWKETPTGWTNWGDRWKIGNEGKEIT